jgi:hypothetical protein
MKPSAHFCFVERDDYDEFRRVSADGGGMDETYDAWLNRIEQFEKAMEQQGGHAQRIVIKPAELAAWCQSQGKEVNGPARADYAAQRAIDEYRKENNWK